MRQENPLELAAMVQPSGESDVLEETTGDAVLEETTGDVDAELDEGDAPDFDES